MVGLNRRVIRIMAPDLASPSGGIKVIYNYVEHLVALGYDARVWHGTPGFGYPSWGSTAPVDTGHRLDFDAGDLLVMPETGGGKWSFLSAGHPVVMLCQGIDFVFADSDFAPMPGRYPGWPQAVAAIAISEAIGTFLDAACAPGFPVHRVPVEIEPWFRPLPKERRIALMPRRRREDLLGAVGLLQRSEAMTGWEVVLIDQMTQAEVAEQMGRAAIFLFGAEREGIGLPGAEAMAAGCYVVGFTGDGAKEYLLPEHAAVIPDSDVLAMAERTLEAMAWFEHEPARLHDLAERGRAFVTARHAGDRVRSALSETFATLTAPDSPALLPRPATLTHYQAHAPKWGVAGAAYVAGRRAARATLDTLDAARGRARGGR